MSEPDAAGPVGPATERRHKIPTDAEMEAAAMRILNQDLEIERLTAELATLRADRDRYRDVVQAAEVLVPLLAESEWFQAQRGGRVWAAFDALAAAVRALGEEP